MYSTLRRQILTRQARVSINRFLNICRLTSCPPCPIKSYSTITTSDPPVNRMICNTNNNITELEYSNVADETLQSLSEYIESFPDDFPTAMDFDVSYGQGVLTVNLEGHGTYVINKQTPNKQIWFSSPLSGPKRFDYLKGKWIYCHDNTFLHDLLTKEFKELLDNDLIDFSHCRYA